MAYGYFYQGCHYELGAGDFPRLLSEEPQATFIEK